MKPIKASVRPLRFAPQKLTVKSATAHKSRSFYDRFSEKIITLLLTHGFRVSIS
jgi:hypothetical protein